MKIITILQITKDYEFGMARNPKEIICLCISRAVRSSDIDALAGLINDTEKTKARAAISAYQNKDKKHNAEYNEEVA